MRTADAQLSEILKAALLASTPSATTNHANQNLPLLPAGMTEQPPVSDGSFAENELAQETLHSMGDAVISMDIAGNLTYLNPAAENLTGWARADALGRPAIDVLCIVDGNTREGVPNPMLQAIENDRTSIANGHWLLVRRDGTELAIQDSAAPIHDRSGQVIGAVMVFRDVGATRAIALKLAYLAQHDLLTGLPNRMLLFDRVEQAIHLALRNSRQFALLFVDMDGFKQINDSFGHSAGDDLLIAIAARLRHCVRDADTVSRFGGDEFVVLLSDLANPADAVVCAYQIGDELRKPFEINRQQLCLTASIGVGLYPKDGRDAETLLTNADQAMLDAKRNGRDRIELCKPRGAVQTISRAMTLTIIHSR